MYNKWLGHRLLACNGSRLVLPNHSSVIKEVGQHKFGSNAYSDRSLALCSTLHDVLNLITIDDQTDKYTSRERDLLVKHLDKVKKGDLLLLYCGYPCIWLCLLLKAKEVNFCMRMKGYWWLEVNYFFKSDKDEKIVSFFFA